MNRTMTQQLDKAEPTVCGCEYGRSERRRTSQAGNHGTNARTLEGPGLLHTVRAGRTQVPR